MSALDRALDEAKQYLKATDDPRNWSAELLMLKLLVAAIEDQKKPT